MKFVLQAIFHVQCLQVLIEIKISIRLKRKIVDVTNHQN